MNKTAVLVFSLGAVIFLSGCASGGNQSIASQNGSTITSSIKIASTTESQVQSIFGDPAQTQYLSNGDTVWTYDYTHTSSDVKNFIPLVNIFDSGTSGYKKELVIDFGPDKTVKSYSMNKSKITTNAGILG